MLTLGKFCSLDITSSHTTHRSFWYFFKYCLQRTSVFYTNKTSCLSKMCYKQKLARVPNFWAPSLSLFSIVPFNSFYIVVFLKIRTLFFRHQGIQIKKKKMFTQKKKEIKLHRASNLSKRPPSKKSWGFDLQWLRLIQFFPSVTSFQPEVKITKPHAGNTGRRW